MNSKSLAGILLLLFFFLATASGQFAQRMDMTGGSIGAVFSAVPTRSFKDTTGGFGYQAVGINFNFPLFGSKKNPVGDEPNKSFYEISAHGAFESENASIGFFPGDRHLYTAGAGFGAIWYNGGKNIFLIDASLGVAADQYVLQNNDEQYRFTGSFIVDNMHRSTFSIFYGAAFTYAYGRPLPLPVLGLRKKLSRAWSMTVLLPLSLDFNDRINKDMSLRFLIRPAGNRFQLQNNGVFDSASTRLYMQLREFEFGISYLYRFAKHFAFSAEAGLLGGGHLTFADADNTSDKIYETGMKPGAKFRLSVRYRFLHARVQSNKIDFENELFRMY